MVNWRSNNFGGHTKKYPKLAAQTLPKFGVTPTKKSHDNSHQQQKQRQKIRTTYAAAASTLGATCTTTILTAATTCTFQSRSADDLRQPQHSARSGQKQPCQPQGTDNSKNGSRHREANAVAQTSPHDELIVDPFVTKKKSWGQGWFVLVVTRRELFRFFCETNRCGDSSVGSGARRGTKPWPSNWERIGGDDDARVGPRVGRDPLPSFTTPTNSYTYRQR